MLKMPTAAHPKNRYAVPVKTATTPERIMPNGWAAIANAIVTEETLPCMFNGIIVCIIVSSDTLTIGTKNAANKPLIAMNQNQPVGVNAIRAYPRKNK
jgi:hypothetical protein